MFTVLCFYLNWAQTQQIYVDENLKYFQKTSEHDTKNEERVVANENKPSHNEDGSRKMKYLERKIKQLESRIPKQFPDVMFLNYRSRKRILVST